MRNDLQTHYRSCNLCEAICGLVVEHDGKQVVSIKGDRDDPLSRGHICPKAIALQDIHQDPNRLTHPIRRDGTTWTRISWDEAFTEIEQRLGAIRAQHGDDAVALYLGNPTVHNYGATLFQKFLGEALSTKHRFAATSVDQLPHHVAASLMFGHSLLIPVPDVDRTDHMLILGANPIASNGSIMTAPGIKSRLKAIRDRGGKLVLVDPRATETSKVVDEHHFIRPGSDVYLLAALLNVIFDAGLEDLGQNHSITKNMEGLRESVRPFTSELAESQTGISRKAIITIATEFAEAESAVCYGRIGISTQLHGGLCQWLANALNLVTGNLDRPGGQMFTNPAVSIVGRQSTTAEFGRWKSRVRGLPEFGGDLPVSVLAEEILTAGEGQIHALITNAGNPVLSTPNGQQLERALEQLDFMVAIDIYLNETTKHANIILPPASGIETDNYDLAFNALAVRNVAKYSPALFKPAQDARYDWQIMQELAIRLKPNGAGIVSKVRHALSKSLLRRLTPQRILNAGLAVGPYGAWRKLFGSHRLNLKRLKRSPHGIDLGPLIPMLPSALRTDDRKIDAAPKVYTQHLAQIAMELSDADSANSFALIGRRHLRSNNSWMHNSERLVKGPDRCTLMMNPLDAKGLNVEAGSIVLVSSSVGEVRLPLEVTDDIMLGVVSMPHGYGHHREGIEIPTAQRHAGVSINDLTDDAVTDELTGNAAFSAQRVTVSAATEIK